MKLSVVIATRNRSNVLRENVVKLLSFSNIHEVIVVDDISNDDTCQIINDLLSKTKSSKSKLKYRRNRRRKGKIGSCIAGSRIATGELVAFLDDDTFVEDTNTIEVVKERFRQYTDVGIVGLRLINVSVGSELRLDPDIYLNYIGDALSSITGFVFLDQSKRPRFAQFVTGCMAVRKEILDTISHDKNYRGTYYREESDAQLGIKRKGWRIFYEPNSVVFHKDPNVGGCKGFNMSERMYCKAINHTYYLRKHYSGFRLIWYMLMGTLLLGFYRPTHLLTVFKGVHDGQKHMKYSEEAYEFRSDRQSCMHA